jgi:hypothetical protein
MKSGMNQVFSKPLNPDLLEELLKKLGYIK